MIKAIYKFIVLIALFLNFNVSYGSYNPLNNEYEEDYNTGKTYKRRQNNRVQKTNKKIKKSNNKHSSEQTIAQLEDELTQGNLHLSNNEPDEAMKNFDNVNNRLNIKKLFSAFKPIYLAIDAHTGCTNGYILKNQESKALKNIELAENLINIIINILNIQNCLKITDDCNFESNNCYIDKFTRNGDNGRDKKIITEKSLKLIELRKKMHDYNKNDFELKINILDLKQISNEDRKSLQSLKLKRKHTCPITFDVNKPAQNCSYSDIEVPIKKRHKKYNLRSTSIDSLECLAEIASNKQPMKINY